MELDLQETAAAFREAFFWIGIGFIACGAVSFRVGFSQYSGTRHLKQQYRRGSKPLMFGICFIVTGIGMMFFVVDLYGFVEDVIGLLMQRFS